MRKIILILLFLFILNINSSAITEWKKEFHDSQNSGYSQYNSSGLIENNYSEIYFGYKGVKNGIGKIDNNGNSIWNYTNASGVYANIIIDEQNFIYFTDGFSLFSLFSNGSLRWVKTYPEFPFEWYGDSIAHDQNSIFLYLESGSYIIAKININNGTLINYTYIDNSIYNEECNDIILDDDNFYFITCYDNDLYAFNKTNMSKIWSNTIHNWDSTPIINLNGNIIILYADSIYEINKYSGIIINETDYITNPAMLTYTVNYPAIQNKNGYYCISGKTNIYGINPALQTCLDSSFGITHQSYFTASDGDNIISSPINDNGWYVYFVTNHHVIQHRIETIGNKISPNENFFRYTGNSLLSNNSIIFAFNDEIASLELDFTPFYENWIFRVVNGESGWTGSPAFGVKNIFFQTSKISGYTKYIDVYNNISIILPQTKIYLNESINTTSDNNGYYEFINPMINIYHMNATKNNAYNVEYKNINYNGTNLNQNFTLNYSKPNIINNGIFGKYFEGIYSNNIRTINLWENPNFVWCVYNWNNNTYYKSSEYLNNKFLCDVIQTDEDYRQWFLYSDMYNWNLSLYHPTLTGKRNFTSNIMSGANIISESDNIHTLSSKKISEREDIIKDNLSDIIFLMIVIIIVIFVGTYNQKKR